MKVIEDTQAEKRVRKLIAVPIKLPYTTEKEEVKKRCREIIKKWGLQRRNQQMREDKLVERTKGASSSALAQLMLKAKASLEQKRTQEIHQATLAKSSFAQTINSEEQAAQQYRAAEIATTGVT